MSAEQEKRVDQVNPVNRVNRAEIMNPEEGEVFGGQRVMVVGGPDAHGVAMAVVSAKYLEKQGAIPEIVVGSPVVKRGEGATHPGAFWSKTIGKLDVAGFDRVVIADIPMDKRDLNQKPKRNQADWVRQSERGLIDLVGRLDQSRESRGLPKLERPVLYLDHHSGDEFEPAWKQGKKKKRMPEAPANVESHGVLVKQVKRAEESRLGRDESLVARIGAIADRDPAVLPVTEDEMRLANGLDIAVKPDPEDPRPLLDKDATEQEKRQYQQDLAGWEERAQARLELAVEKLGNEEWEYFRREAEKLERVEIPVAGQFGEVVLVDTQGLTSSFSVLKLMEQVIERTGVDQSPYGMAVLRQAGDEVKMGREPADLITVIRHFSREDMPSVKDKLREVLGEEFLAQGGVYGAENAVTMRLPVDDVETAKLAATLLEVFGGEELPDLSEVKTVVGCGDPNSGKSVMSTILREALTTLGVKVKHLDLDKAAPTPQSYLDAEIGYKQALNAFEKDRISQAVVDEAKARLEQAKAERLASKRPWSNDLAREARDELRAAGADPEAEFVIGDIGGGRPIKDAEGKTIGVQRLSEVNAIILEAADAVVIVSNNPAGAAEWKNLVEVGIDPETGVRVERETPIKVIALYQSVLEGSQQWVAEGEEMGVVTNLDRSLAERIYNPAVFAIAMFIARSVENRRVRQGRAGKARDNLN